MLFLGQHNVVKFGPLYFWPERGMIHCEDSRDNSYLTMSVTEALERTRGINDMIGRSSDYKEYVDEREYHQRFVEDMVNIIRVAREQGSPDDPSACRDLARRRAKPVRIEYNIDMEL